MMREIKCRAWDEDAEIMYYSDKDYEDCFFGFDKGVVVGWLRQTEPETRDEHAYDYGKAIPVMQFTGLHDKNGKEIYEGDKLKDDVGDIGIVRFGKLPLDKSGDCVCTYHAFYLECLGQLGRAPTYECADIGNWMEVIGNIHENKNILDSNSAL